MGSKAKTLVKGSILRTFNFFVNIVIAFFLMPFIIHSLGDRMYGLWMVIGSFLGFYWLFDFGLGSAIQRYVSRAIGKEDYKEANLVINSSLFLFLIIGLFTLFISFVVSFISPLFMKNIAEVVIFRQVIIVLGCSFAIGLPMRVFSGILTAHLRYDLNTIVTMSKLLIRTILVVIFLKKGYGVLALALITFISDIISYFFAFIFAKKIAKYIVLSKTLVDKTKIKSLFKYSIFTFIAQIADKLRFNIDNFIIAAFVGLNFVTVYSIASRLIQYFMNFIVSAVGLMIPVFSQYESKGDYNSIRKKFILVTKLSSYLSVLIGGTVILFGKVFIERWMGKDYLSAYPLLVVLVIPIIIALMQSPSIQLLYGISKHKFFAISNSVEGVANLILSLILVQKFGLMGVAFGTAIPMIIIKLFVQPVYTCKAIKLSVWKYYFEIVFSILLKSLIGFIGFWWIIKSFIIPNYLNLLVLISCELVFFAGAVFFVGLNNIEQNYFKKLIFSNE